MSTQRLSGRVAAVTGGASGIGEATAVRLAAEGARVVVGDVNEAGAARVAEEIVRRGGSAVPCAVDIADPASVEAFLETTLHAFGALHVVDNNATAGGMGRVGDVTVADWNRTLAVNLTGHFLVIRASLPHLLAAGGGSIVNVSSVAALTAEAGLGAYAAAKAGLLALTRNVAAEYGALGIRCNAVCPGAIATPPTKAFIAAVDGMRERMERANPMRRLGRAEEVAALVAFLASDDASFVNGATYVVDGGAYADKSVGLLGGD